MLEEWQFVHYIVATSVNSGKLDNPNMMLLMQCACWVFQVTKIVFLS